MDWSKLKDEGNLLLKNGDIAGAIEKYSQALELCKDEKENEQILYSNRSAAYLKNSQNEEALADANRCIEVGPTWSKGYSRKAAVLREMKKYSEAVEVAEAGLVYEPTNVALKALQKACQTSIVCDKLRGTWHGRVAEEVGGYMQSFDFWSDTDVRVSVLGTTVDAKYELDVFGKPYPHLDMSVPNSPGSAFVRHIYKFENDDELHLCSPYLRPPEERPTEFKGAGMVIMKRGLHVLSPEEQRERDEMMSKSLDDRVVMFLEQCVAAVPNFDVRPREGESEVVIGEKLTANVKFQTFYQGLVEKLGADAEQQVKELVVGIRALQNEAPRVVELVNKFQERMRHAGLISDGEEPQQTQPAQSDQTNAVVGVAPEEVLQSKEAMARFVSGADEPLAEIDPSIQVPVSSKTEPVKAVAKKPSIGSPSPERDLTPVIIGAAVVTALAAVAAAVWFSGHDRE